MMPLVSAADSDGDGVDDADDDCPDTVDQDDWSIADNGCSYPTYLDDVWMCVEEGIAVTDLATEWKTADDEHICNVSLSYDSTYMTITTPGIANHDMQGGPGGGINDQNYEWVLPLVPEDDSDCNPSESTNGCEMAPELGPIAVAVNGVPFYGPEDGPGGDAVATHIGQYTETEQEIWLGVCGAHAGPGGTYHYHYDGNCMHWHPENEGETHQVSITDDKDFLPEDLTINVGDTVTWTNDDDSSHTVTAEDGQFHSENMEEEATWSYTFTETGTYDYGCNYHGGMEGSVSVVEEDEEVIWTDYTFDQVDNSVHSPIIGFAFDGYPIYGAYGTVDGEVTLMRSSYELNDEADGSNGIQDYQYIKDSGHLDACNGVLSVTPEFPDGIYHYHSTMPVEVDGEMTTNHAFPYFINCYAGIAITSNMEGGGGMQGPPDADGDGVGDGWDMCADTGDTAYPDGYPIYPRGCTEEQLSVLSSEEQDAAKIAYAGDNPPAPPDDDGDGIPDPLDDCDDTEAGKLVYLDGCAHETTDNEEENGEGNGNTTANETEEAPDSDDDGIPDDDDLCPEENASDRDTNADGCIDDMEKETADCKLTMEIMNESFCFSAEDADGNGRPDDFDSFCQDPASNEKIGNVTAYYIWLDSQFDEDDPNDVETHNALSEVNSELRECEIEKARRENEEALQKLEDAESLSEKWYMPGFGVVATILSCLVIASRRKS
jgi:plastocyanin